MLPAATRLRRPADFALAVRRGRRVGRPLLVVHLFVSAASPEPFQPARAGLVVSKAVGGAVIRTQVKRRLRHLLACRLPELPAGAILVIRALPAAAAADSAALGADLDVALERLRA